jgi:hypothetical protein
MFLTNNGLYAMGCNKMGQLGIDQSVRLNIALQPMLIKALDNKIVTQISVGQHHNAVVADDKLYTWGWNVYGQCAHNEIRNIREPRVVEFFNDKVRRFLIKQLRGFFIVTNFSNRKSNKLLAARLTLWCSLTKRSMAIFTHVSTLSARIILVNSGLEITERMTSIRTKTTH